VPPFAEYNIYKESIQSRSNQLARELHIVAEKQLVETRHNVRTGHVRKELPVSSSTKVQGEATSPEINDDNVAEIVTRPCQKFTSDVIIVESGSVEKRKLCLMRSDNESEVEKKRHNHKEFDQF
jgi:hypothetical protein